MICLGRKLHGDAGGGGVRAGCGDRSRNPGGTMHEERSGFHQNASATLL